MSFFISATPMKQTLPVHYNTQPIKKRSQPYFPLDDDAAFYAAQRKIVEGVVFPCSWLSFPYNDLTYKNKTINWKDTFFAMYREKMNIRNRPFEDIINDPLWNKCSSGWKDESKTWVECGMKCNQSIVDQEYAVGWLTN